MLYNWITRYLLIMFRYFVSSQLHCLCLDLSNKNKGLLGRFDSAREQVQWYGNNGLQARAWGQQFQYRY